MVSPPPVSIISYCHNAMHHRFKSLFLGTLARFLHHRELSATINGRDSIGDAEALGNLSLWIIISRPGRTHRSLSIHIHAYQD
jgi:hypothetical protein